MSYISVFGISFLVATVLGCTTVPAGTAPASPAAGAAPSPKVQRVLLSVRIDGESNGVTRVLKRCDALRRGDAIALHIRVNRPAFLYVLQVLANGRAAILYPMRGDMLMTPGAETRVPDWGDVFQVDDTLGEESIFVVASVSPLEQADIELAHYVRGIRRADMHSSRPPEACRTSAAPSAKAPPQRSSKGTTGPPSKGTNIGRPEGNLAEAKQTAQDPSIGGWSERSPPLVERGMQLVRQDSMGVSTVEADDKGIAILQFPFRHITR